MKVIQGRNGLSDSKSRAAEVACGFDSRPGHGVTPPEVESPGTQSGNNSGYRLANRPDILAFLDAAALDLLLAPTRTTRGWS